MVYWIRYEETNGLHPSITSVYNLNLKSNTGRYI